MPQYNIVDAADLVEGMLEDVSVVLANLQAIQAILNGHVDLDNLDPAIFPLVTGRPNVADGATTVVTPPVIEFENALVSDDGGNALVSIPVVKWFAQLANIDATPPDVLLATIGPLTVWGRSNGFECKTILKCTLADTAVTDYAQGPEGVSAFIFDGSPSTEQEIGYETQGLTAPQMVGPYDGSTGVMLGDGSAWYNIQHSIWIPTGSTTATFVGVAIRATP